jgi:hypothetical protein
MNKLTVGVTALGVCVAGAYFVLTAISEQQAHARVEQAAGEIRKHVKQFDYAEVSVAPLNRSVEIKDVRLADGFGRAFSIGAVRIEQFDWMAHDIPRYATVRLSGVRVSVDANAAPLLGSYGYDHVEAQVEFGYALDERGRTLEMKLRLDATDVGVLTFAVTIGGVDSALIGEGMRSVRNPSAMDSLSMGIASLAVTLIEASATYEDRSLMERSIKAEAERSRKGRDQVRAELLQTVTRQRGGASDPQTLQAFDAVSGFIRQPGAIRLSLTPRPPASYAEILANLMAGQQGALADRLQVRVTRE